MKRFLLIAGSFALLAAALAAVPVSRAAEVEGDGDAEALQARPKGAPKKKILKGHTHLSKASMAAKKNGTHHIHTGASGHKSHALLSKGKLRGMKVTHKGRPVHVKSFRKSAGRASAAVATGEVEPAQFVGGFIVFYFFNPLQNQFVYFVWPISSVSPQVANNTPEANGSEEQNIDVDE
jgi:hypothetical protein